MPDTPCKLRPKRQNSHSGTLGLDSHDGAMFEFTLILLQCSDDQSSDAFREDILRPDLDDAGAFSLGGRQKGREIEVVGKTI